MAYVSEQDFATFNDKENCLKCKRYVLKDCPNPLTITLQGGCKNFVSIEINK